MALLGFKRIATAQKTGESHVVDRVYLETTDPKQIQLANDVGWAPQTAASAFSDFQRDGNLNMRLDVFDIADPKERPYFDCSTGKLVK